MNRMDDFLNRQRRITPPAHLAPDLERAVLARMRTPSRNFRPVRALSIALSCAVGVAVVVAVLTFHRQKPQYLSFTESTILLDDHICIWLEAVDVPAGEKAKR